MTTTTETTGESTRGNGFTPSTRMDEAVRKDPDMHVVLMRFHIGGCSLCGFEPDDTIEQVARDNGVPTDVLLGAMNKDA